MLTLTSGFSSLVVAPEYGAAVTGWMFGNTPILRRASPQASLSGDRHNMACFPLLPYANRIGQGRFHWRGEDYQVDRNLGDHPHSIHGVGWQSRWQTAEADARTVFLMLDHQPNTGWPFAFQASIRYSLSPTDLTVRLEITSRHHAVAPAGIGLHPFFPKANDPTLRFDATGAWENDATQLPLRHGPLPAGWQHSEPRRIAGSRLDNCFTGWNGSADIAAGPASLRIEASEVFRQLQVFTPVWGNFFCVEPVSHVPDAVNRPDLPADQAMHVLDPGQTLAGIIRFVLA